MSEKRSYGLASLKMGDIAADGGMGTTLAVLGVTLADSAELTQEDGTSTEVTSEENDDPEEILEEKGKTTLKFSIIDYTPATLQKVLGGSVTAATETVPAIWNGPSAVETIEKSFEVISKSGVVFKIVRGRVKSKITAKFSKKGVAQVDVTVTVMSPTKANTAPIQISSTTV